ncbi:hypothetical protein T265_11908 [Opisthorchis viverrini]|uniref:Uncharacterized protein n=1 Tax=Opisthorchis viverrini TaxID=6198 RepID=A0A074Z7R0_OPIVI|nr:hypothetical protein T265_11908 [Opisthorchis viverrini]KER19260.1 hypothetical protein T265_11908 [Opisthorchis viverrini]
MVNPSYEFPSKPSSDTTSRLACCVYSSWCWAKVSRPRIVRSWLPLCTLQHTVYCLNTRHLLTLAQNEPSECVGQKHGLPEEPAVNVSQTGRAFVPGATSVALQGQTLLYFEENACRADLHKCLPTAERQLLHYHILQVATKIFAGSPLTAMKRASHCLTSSLWNIGAYEEI